MSDDDDCLEAELRAIDRLIAEAKARAEDTASERSWADDTSGLRSISPVREQRRDTLTGFTVGDKVLHKPFQVNARVIQLASPGDFMNTGNVRVEW